MTTRPGQSQIGELREGEPQGEPEAGLCVFELTAAADFTDPHWEVYPYQGTVLVHARSAADARIVAAEAEIDFPESRAKPAHGARTAPSSAFRNEKLYSVRLVSRVDGRTVRGVLQRDFPAGDAPVKPSV